MKNSVGLMVVLALFTGYASSQDGEVDQAEMMKKMNAHGTPGPHHKSLEYFLGEWDTATLMWMGPEPVAAKGVATFSWLFPGGKWLKQESNGNLMGMPMQGFGVLGYDNFKKKYVQIWVDSMSTSMLWSEGVPVDKTGQVSVTYGPIDEYLNGQNDKTVKYTTRRIDKDKFVFEINDLAIGENGKVVIRITYTRKK